MTTINLLIGELLTGRITTTLSGGELPTSLHWTDVLNGAGSIDGVTIPSGIVRKYDLRQQTHGIRCFLAVEVNGRIKQAGPIWSRTWDDDKGELTLGASGLWSYFDKRIIYPVGVAPPYAERSFDVSGKSLGGIARALIERSLLSPYAPLPIVLPPDEAGDHTESFPLYSTLDYGEQLRQITQRATDAPDIAFRPRRRGDDPRFIEWVMLVGTEIQPALLQAGDDWVFDRSAPKSSVLRISTDEDANEMAQQVWATGNGQEESTKMALWNNVALNIQSSPWPLTDSTILRASVEDDATLTEHAAAHLARVNRPIEVLKVSARLDRYNEVAAGDYSRTITRDDVWLGDMDITTRIRQVSGDLSDTLTFEMFSVQANL